MLNLEKLKLILYCVNLKSHFLKNMRHNALNILHNFKIDGIVFIILRFLQNMLASYYLCNF